MYPGGDFACAGMRRAAALICESEGFSHAEDGAFEILVSALAHYIETVGGHAQQLAELGGRAQADLRDLRAALQHCEAKFGSAACDDAVNAEDLPDNAEDCFGSELPAFPVAPGILEPCYALAPEDLQHSQQPREPHIPAFLPPFPPTWCLSGTKDSAKSHDAANHASVDSREDAKTALMQLSDDFLDPATLEDGQVSVPQPSHHTVSQWHANTPDSESRRTPLCPAASFLISETAKSKPHRSVAEDITGPTEHHPTLATVPEKTRESRETASEKSGPSTHSTMTSEVAGSHVQIAASSAGGPPSSMRRSVRNKGGSAPAMTPPTTRRSTRAASAQPHAPTILESEAAEKQMDLIESLPGSTALVGPPLLPPNEASVVEQRGAMTTSATVTTAATAATTVATETGRAGPPAGSPQAKRTKRSLKIA